MKDNFNGDNAKLVDSIEALLALDASGSLVPHGVGGHARTLLEAAAARLTPLADAAAIAEQDKPYAYEIGDPRLTQQLVYPAYLARYATDEERALPRVPLYARAALSTTKVVAWANAREDGVIVGLSQHPEDIARWLNPRALCYAHPASEPKAPYLPCPICNCVEGCDHTVPERCAASEPKALTDEQIMAAAGNYSDVDRAGYIRFNEDDLINFSRSLLADRGSEGK